MFYSTGPRTPYYRDFIIVNKVQIDRQIQCYIKKKLFSAGMLDSNPQPRDEGASDLLLCSTAGLLSPPFNIAS
jgi:hypothetical protein